MTETPDTVTPPAEPPVVDQEPPAAKKTAKRAAKKTTKKAAAKKVTVFLVGASHGGKDGDRRQVEPDRAEELVRAGLARYPATDKTSRRPAFLR